MTDANDSARQRRSRAGRVALTAALTVFLVDVIAFPVLVLLGYGAPLSFRTGPRLVILLKGALILSAASALIGYAVTRLVIRIRRGPLAGET